MEYSLNAGAWNSVFAVPSSVVDDYIKLAGGNSLKVLLYLLRHGGVAVTSERLKAELGFAEDGELEDAVTFWAQRGIIRAESAKGRTAVIADNAAKPAAAEAPTTAAPVAKIQKAKPPTFTNGEIARSITDAPEMRTLFEEAEKLYARPLKESERQLIMQLTEHYRLPCEVSLMLLQYCFKLEKTRPAYITKAAEDWANDGISTVQLADERIRAMEKQDSAEQRICEALGLSSKLSANMRGFIKVWTVDWGFGDDMIMYAYDKTVEATGGWNPPYANKILESWKSAGITTTAAAKKSDEDFRKANSFKAPPVKRSMKPAPKSSSFDADLLKQKIMSNYKK